MYMEEQLYSAEDVARRLGLHVRTVRGYVREGRLKAVRIGKQYRIRQADLDEFVGVAVNDSPVVRRHRHAEVSSIVEVDGVDPETFSRIGTLLLGASARHDGPAIRVETAYDERRARMKIIVLAGVADTARLLEYVQMVVES